MQEKRYKGNTPGYVILRPPTDNISELYDEADIMISASITESFSFCLAEAIYSGLPAVFSDIPGTSWAKAFKNTYMFKTGSAEDIIRALNEINNSISEEELSFNRQLMQEKYSMDSWSNKVIDYVMEKVE